VTLFIYLIESMVSSQISPTSHSFRYRGTQNSTSRTVCSLILFAPNILSTNVMSRCVFTLYPPASHNNRMYYPLSILNVHVKTLNGSFFPRTHFNSSLAPSPSSLMSMTGPRISLFPGPFPTPRWLSSPPSLFL